MESLIMSSSLGAMGPLLAKLHRLLDSSEYQLRKPLPLREQIEPLKKVLEEIYALLADLSREQAPNTMAKLWMNEVRDLSYEVEDYIDKMTHRHYDSGKEIPFEGEEFSTHVEQANDARTRYDRYVRGRWASNPSFMVNGRAHVPTLSGEAAGLVGMGDLRSKLISWLRDDAEQLKKVVPILGPAGVGKTTLAQEVYRQIGGHFDCRAFVQASQTPDTRRLLRSMISQVQRHERLPYAYTVQDLKDRLRGHLQRKRYFIVIDGLWETSSWDIVRSAFPEGTHCSRILVTTDIKEVALECCDYHSDGIFQMEQLGGTYPTELFFKRVFGSSKDKCPEHLHKDSEEIIRTCDGLPLAIIMISSILSCEPANSELWKHVKECLSYSMKTNFTLKDMLSEIVLLSCNNLPNHLKTCLLYLSLYPEGYTFLKVDLVKQWTAEGFTSAAGKKGTNQDAEDFFDELVCRGLIQPYHINFPEEVMFYTVHSTVFEVIRNKSKEDNFTTVVDYSNTVRQLSRRARRLSLRFSNSKYAKKPEGIKLSTVRSLNFYGLIECFPLIMKFEVLRVLVLELWGALEELDLSSIDTLFQLRYLWIRSDVSVKLPAKMRGLQYLETLEIYARVTSVPSDIVYLSRLLHLCLPGEINLSNGIGHMKSLRSLQSFDLSSNSESNVLQLSEMIDLQYLHLTCSTETSNLLERNLIALVSSLGEHRQLKSLVLEPGAGASCTSIYLDCSSSVSSPPVFLQRLELLPPLCIFSRLPKWIGRLRKLCTLKITVRELTSYDVSSITGLQELTVLSLYVRQPTAESIIFSCAAFPVLKYFKFSCGILRLAFQAKAMPNLRWLNLKFNAHKQEQYGNIVAGIEHLLNLEEITVRIGAGPGAEESDRTTAESAIKDTICRHSRPLSISVGRVDSIVEDDKFLGFRTELMAEAVLIVLSKIGNVLGDEVIKFVIAEASKKVANLRELPENIRHIGEDMKMMNSVVQDLDTMNLSFNVVKEWITNLRNLAFRVEDVIDKYSYHAFKMQVEGPLMRLVKGAHNAKVFSDIADEVVYIKDEIERVKQRRRYYFPAVQIVQASSSEMVRQGYQVCLPGLILDEDLVGISLNQAKLIGWLHSNEPNNTVITVSGMGGLGKTTLVMNVYERMKSEFPVNAWITVSQTYTIVGLLRELLREIGKDTYKPSDSIESMDAYKLREEIKNVLGTRKCLFVLDDVWNKEVYHQMMEDIFNTPRASRIIITTRREDVASLASSGCHLQLQPLGRYDAVDLFCRRAFNNTADRKCPQELKDVAASIVERCKGLPLGIISMGSLMSSKKPTKHAWNQMYNQFRVELAKPDNVQAILKLSYNDLPGNLRNCFLYCCLFPEDHIMSRESLVRQWVAEGFAVTNGNNTLEEVAELNLEELITRNMLQVVEYDELGRVNTCKMHDIVRDLALSIAKDEKFGTANHQGAMIQMNADVRRLSLCGWNDSGLPTVRFPHLRTLFSLDGVMSTHMLASIFSESSYLTVLELQDSEITAVPASIGNLFNLRYIGLRRTGVKSLPECVEKLSNLQTLDIKQTKIEKLPRGIDKVKKLRHLLADRVVDEKQKDFQYFAGVQPPKYLSNLVELQTLETVEATNDLGNQLDKLRKLQSVWIGKVSAMHSAKLFATLSKLPLLSSLLLTAIDEEQTLQLEALNPQSKQLRKLIVRGRWADKTLQCPIFRGHGENLKYLALSWSGLQEDPLLLMAPHVPNLTYLSLNRVSSTETMVISEGSFPQLKTLILKNMLNVNQLTVGKDALPNIEGLYIVALPKLNKVPQGFESLVSLRKLWLLSLHKDFKILWELNRMRQKMPQVVEVRVE